MGLYLAKSGRLQPQWEQPLDEPTIAEWQKLRAVWMSVREAFDKLPAKPDPDAQAVKPAGLMESDVSGRFIHQLIEVLGWGAGEYFSEQQLTIRVGSKNKVAIPDFIIAPSKDDALVPGKPWAVIEAKRACDGPMAFENARQQARLYADHLRVPVYAVIDKRKISVWQRFLLRDDAPVQVELAISELGDDARTRLLWRALGSPIREDATRDRGAMASAPVLAASISNPLPEHYVYIKIDLSGGNAKLRMTESTRAKTIDASWWWGEPEDPGADRRRVVIILGPLDAKGGCRQIRPVLARLQRHGTIAPLQCEEPGDWTTWARGHRFALDGAYLMPDDAELAQVPEAGWSLDKEDDLIDVDLGTWVNEVTVSLDDWVVACTRLDWEDFVAMDSTRTLPGAEEWRQSDDAGLRRTLADAMTELGSVTAEHIRAAFWSHGAGSISTERKQAAGLHLGPRTRLPVLETLCMLAAVRRALPDTSLKLDYNKGKYTANLVFGPNGQDGRAIALDRLEPTHFRRQEDLRWATMALFRSIHAYELHDKLTLKSLSHPITSGIGAERVGKERLHPLVFVLSTSLRESLQTGNWAEVEAELFKQLNRTVSK